MKTRDPFVASLALAMFASSCGRDSQLAGGGSADRPGAAAPRGPCAHTVCGNDFFVDTTSVGRCVVGGACTVTLGLVAAGEYHINDEYPYKFKADDEPGLEFLGTDDAGRNVFSKSAKNWMKTGEKTGTMTVTFRPSEAGPKAVAGTFKFSVCSANNCELEHQQLKTTLDVL